MKKLVLEMDALQVESFEPVAEERRAAGTVHGRESVINPSNEGDVTCPNHTCLPPPTLDSSPACCVGP